MNLQECKSIGTHWVALYVNAENVTYFLILASTIIGCILISTFASLLVILIGTTSSETGLTICAITAERSISQ